MYKEIRRDGNHSTWEVVQLICDSDADIPSLPTLTDPSADGKHQPCAPGSTVKVLASKCIYILNNEGEWVLYEDNGSGLSGTLTYKTYDGTTTLHTENILVGGNGTYANTESRDADAQYTYTPNGWATTVNGDPDEYAIKNVVGARTVYAAYDKHERM